MPSSSPVSSDDIISALLPSEETTPPPPSRPTTTPPTAPTPKCLRFRPLPGRNYARDFALAVRDAYDNDYIPRSGRDVQLVWAQRVIDGEGSDLVFRNGYIDMLQTKTWNGEDERVRRGAFLHILGSTTAKCTYVDCRWKTPSIDATCLPCRENHGHFEGCRHEHYQIGRNGQCSNCAANCTPSHCTFCQKRRETKPKRSLEELETTNKRLLLSSVPTQNLLLSIHTQNSPLSNHL